MTFWFQIIFLLFKCDNFELVFNIVDFFRLVFWMVGVGRFLHDWLESSELGDQKQFSFLKCIGFQSPNEILSNRILFGLVIVFSQLTARKSAISDATTSGFPPASNKELVSKKLHTTTKTH